MKLIELDRNTTERCKDFGCDIVRRYENDETPQSRAFSSHGAESNIDLQIEAKMAECIFAVSLGLPIDPLFEQTTRSWDVRTRFQSIDVKQTSLNGHYLIWPLNKNRIFASKRFDLLALVKNNWNCGAPVGWITKQGFADLKSVAGPGHKLTPGTWFVHDEQLQLMAALPNHEASIGLERLKQRRLELDAALQALEDTLPKPSEWLPDSLMDEIAARTRVSA